MTLDSLTMRWAPELMLQHHHATPTKPERVLILGASGFVAGDLARHLSQEKIEYRAIASTEIDLLQPQSVAQLQSAIRPADAVVVTSGLTPDKGKDVGTLMKNLTMAQHLAAALEAGACGHLIYISSDAVYDWRESLIRETSVRQAIDLYGLMHIAREQMLAFTAAKTKTPLCIFCPGAIYGAGDTHNSYGPNRFFRTAMKDRAITLFGGGEETRDHIYIEDVSRLLGLCLRHRSAGIINAVSGQAVTFHEIASRVAKLAGPDVEIQCLPRGGPITHRHFDVTERIKAFPLFSPTALEDGLAATFLRLTERQQG
jgi:nucleoside-diphosphate-sugar epimerase